MLELQIQMHFVTPLKGQPLLYCCYYSDRYSFPYAKNIVMLHQFRIITPFAITDQIINLSFTHLPANVESPNKVTSIHFDQNLLKNKVVSVQL